jgi:serine protease AprX
MPSHSNEKSWRGAALVVLLAALVFAYPTIESILFGPLIPTSEWAFEDTGIRTLQSQGLDGSGVHICIVDTGIDISHPALSEVNLGGFLDLVGSNPEGPPIEYGEDHHGTMMAGILVSTGAFEGAATGATLSVAAALGPTGYSIKDGAVGEAVEWCWKTQQADIISLSLGGEADPNIAIGGPTVTSVEDALEAGVIVVAAAGNQGENSSDVSTPASIEGVIAVGATDRYGSPWKDTSRGSTSLNGEQREDPNLKPEISAPGEDIISTNDPSLSIPYASSSGTSVSTVFVVGSLALIMEKNQLELIEYKESNGSELYIHLIKNTLQQSMMEGMHDSRSGYGVLDAVSWEINISDSLP